MLHLAHQVIHSYQERGPTLLLLPVLCKINKTKGLQKGERSGAAASYIKATSMFGRITKILSFLIILASAGSLCAKDLIVADQKEDVSSISVLFWNVYLLPDLLVSDPEKQNRASQIPHAIARQNADIVVLSEMFHDALSDQIIQSLSSHYPFHTQILADDMSIWERNFPTFEGGGVIILSKYKIERSDEMVFADASGLDQFSNKGVIYAQIRKHGQPFHLFASHLQAYADSQTIREKQLKEFASFIKQQKLPTSSPVLFAGDFNINFHEKEMFKSLISSLNGRPLGLKLEPFAFSYDPMSNGLIEDGKPELLDYILVSNDHAQPTIAKTVILPMRWSSTDKSMTIEQDLSDHHAIFGVFQF